MNNVILKNLFGNYRCLIVGFGLVITFGFFVPGTMAAETAVDTTIFTTNTAGITGAPAAVCVTDLNCFVFYLDSGGGISMASTTNGGTSWTGGRNVDSVNTADAFSVAIWWEGWTPGTTTGRYIHIATTDTGVDDTYYTRYDIASNTLSTSVVATTQSAACNATRGSDCYTAITMVASGTLYMAGAEAADRWVVSCSATCTTGGNWSERTSAFYDSNGDDFPLLAPIPGTNNVMLVWWDVTLDDILYNIYSATSSSWQHGVGATGTITTTAEDNATYDGQLFGIAIATSTGEIALAYIDDANDYSTQDHDIRFWLYSSTTSWVQKTLPITNASGGLTGVKPSYDEYNDIWYVIYGRRSTIGIATTTRIYYRTSADSGNTWSGELGPVSDNADDVNALTTGITSNDRIGAWWNYTTAPRADQEYYNVVTDIIPQTISGTLYDNDRVTPITSSKTIKVVTGPSQSNIFSTTTVSGSGTFTINVPNQKTATGTPISVYVDGDIVDATTFTKASSTYDISGLDLYQDTIIVKNESSATTTRATDLVVYDSTDDDDVGFTASSSLGSLVLGSSQSLYIYSSTTFHQDAPLVVPGDLIISESASFLASSTLIIGGDYTNDGNFISLATSTWATSSSLDSYYWNSVTYGNGLFVAVCQTDDSFNPCGVLMTSPDGIDWTSRTAAASSGWTSVTYGNGRFVAVANSGSHRVMTSTNGTTWATSSAAEANTWRSVAYGDGRFVAVSQDGTNQVMTSTNGTTWATSSAAEDNLWSSVTYGSGRFVAVCEYDSVFSPCDHVMTSTNGTTWATSSAAVASTWNSVTYGNGLFVAVSGSGNRMMTSPDGLTWTIRTAAEANNWSSVTYGNGLFVAVAGFGANNRRIMVSRNGIEWYSRLVPDPIPWKSVTYGNGRFVAVASEGTDRVMLSIEDFPVSFNGDTAQVLSGSMTSSATLPSVFFSNDGSKEFTSNASSSNFRIDASSGEVIAPVSLTITGDLENESIFTAPTNLYLFGQNQAVVGDLVGLSDLNNLYVRGSKKTIYGNASTTDLIVYNNSEILLPEAFSVTGDYTNNGTSSTQASVWTEHQSIGSQSWSSVTYGNGLFVAVSQSGTNRVMTSPDGVNWTARSAAEANSWTSVTYGNGLFVAVASDGTNRVMTSTNGTTWATSSAAEANAWISVTYGNGLFVAGASDGTNRVMTSPDGVNWTARSVADNDEIWNSITYGNGLFVAVGFDGTDFIVTSTDGTTWSTSTPAEEGVWSSVTYGNGLFVAVASFGASQVMISTDGITWATSSAAEANAWISVTYGNGLFVAGASDGTNRVMTSPDGVNWTARSVAGDDDVWSSITYGNGRFVAVAGGSATVANSAVTTLYLTGNSPQTLSGSLSNYNELGNVVIRGSGAKNFSTAASTTNLTIENSASTTFSESLSVREIFSAGAGAKVEFADLATTTIFRLVINGEEGSEVVIRSENEDSQYNLVITDSYSIAYSDFMDTNGCGSVGGEIDASDGTSIDSGNNTCVSLFSSEPAIGMDDDYHFYLGEATTTLGNITISDSLLAATILATNDIRLNIATSTTNFRFDITNTTLGFAGSAASKVSNPVSYENDGATLVISVGTDFSPGETLLVSGIRVGNFAAISSETSRIILNNEGSLSTTSRASSTQTFRITGLVSVSDHPENQPVNKFGIANVEDETMFRFSLTPSGESATITDMVLSVSEIEGVETGEFFDLKLYRDIDSDGIYDVGDELLDGSGIFNINGQYGAITFSNNFTVTSTASYIVTGDTNGLDRSDTLNINLTSSGITAVGFLSGLEPRIAGFTSKAQHLRSGTGSGGSSSRIGGSIPTGDGLIVGGGEGGGEEVGQDRDGENIAYDPDFKRPTVVATPNDWTNASNAFDSDGVYATAASSNLEQSYGNFNFVIPSSNNILGISVKIDASGSTASGVLDVALTWDEGASWTTTKATPSLSGSDIVYLVGGANDLWGHGWAANELGNEFFQVRITSNVDSNTLRLDALEIRVHHQSVGGSGGGSGGGRI